MPVVMNSTLLNCAVVCQKGKILGIVPKTYLPNYKEFYEQRWFTSALNHPDTNIRLCGQNVPVSANLLFDTPDTCFGIEICEDMWAPIPPSSSLALQGAEIIFNMSADNEGIGKHAYVRSLISQQSARCLAGYVFSSSGFGESTTDVVFAGNGLIYENGSLLAESERFSFKEQLVISEIDVERIRGERLTNTTFAANIGNCPGRPAIHINTEFVNTRDLTLTRPIEPHPFVPQGNELDQRCEEIFAIQIAGLAKRLVHTNCKTVVVGISGGLDSTLALLVCVKTFDKLELPRKNIIGITMPGFGTTDRTYNNALHLMASLGVTIKEISIKEACIRHFKDIDHDMTVHDVTYENSQARERTQILMDVANRLGGLVIGTGDLSELALGWATYNGDHMSMYGVNASIPKTLVKYLVNWIALNGVDNESRITLLDIVDTPISPELIPADEQGNIKQKTEDLVGPYELHDFFLYQFLRFGFRPGKIFYLASIAFRDTYNEEVIKKWLTTFCPVSYTHLRCQCRNVAERMRRIITFSSFYRVICKAPLMRIYVQAHTYVHAGPHIYTRRPIRTFTQACAYIRVDTCILSTLPAYSPSLNTPFAGRHLKMINISSHRHLDGTRQGLEDSFYLMMFIISFCLDIEIHTCCITQ